MVLHWKPKIASLVDVCPGKDSSFLTEIVNQETYDIDKILSLWQCPIKMAEKVKALANAKWQYYSHQHLKEVELIDFIGSRNELEIVLFVLEIAASVETEPYLFPSTITCNGVSASIVGEFCLRFDDRNSDKILSKILHASHVKENIDGFNMLFVPFLIIKICFPLYLLCIDEFGNDELVANINRGLDLSDTIIEEMPNTVCTPYNLHTLLLKGCEKLRRDFDDLSVRAKAARILVVLLCKHEFDARYQKPENKLYIAQLYFPLIGRK
ncbi:hypothetical protein FNV43_RR19522 [Rhamnella rubrinervis]|uniref:Uncharacterized protein n=1 Tax=Rhamnella rubrinervis TaxID=2594499 RepID=A0A8K0DYX6_9ROSA|nr:hypothetical protein FNV43_RR19522 [Rhamnella rubrinervis]